ncbi:MAG TPA: NAD(P)-dependent oxidoreductase [Acidimicrobiales bacterium]
MRVFVAGGTGAVGRPLVSRLVAAGHAVTVFSRTEDREAALGVPGVIAAVGDALNARALTAAVGAAQPEVVVNQLTNLAPSMNPVALARGLKQTARLRQEASGTLVEAARSAGARRVIAQSISFIYRPGPGTRTEADPLWTDAGGQIGALAQPVAALEVQTLGAAGIEGVVLRYGSFYGPGTYFGPEGAFTGLVRRRLMPVAGRGGGLFGFVHLDDAVGATMAALEGPTGVYNVVDDVPAASSEWIPFVAARLGAKAPRHLPEALVRAVAGKHSAYLMCAQPAVSNHRARTELGWEPAYADWHAGFRAVLSAG